MFTLNPRKKLTLALVCALLIAQTTTPMTTPELSTESLLSHSIIGCISLFTGAALYALINAYFFKNQPTRVIVPPAFQEQISQKNQQLEDLMRAMQQEHNTTIKGLIAQKKTIKQLSVSNKRLQTSLCTVACQTNRAIKKSNQLLAHIDDSCKGRNGTIPAVIGYCLMNKIRKQERELAQHKQESQNTQSRALSEEKK